MSSSRPTEIVSGLYETRGLSAPALLAATLVGQATTPIPDMCGFIAQQTGCTATEISITQTRLIEHGLLQLDSGELIVSGLHDEAMRIATAPNVQVGDQLIPRPQFQKSIIEWRAALAPTPKPQQTRYGCLTPAFCGFLYTIVKRSLSAKRVR